MKITLNSFRGIAPKIDEKALREDAAQVALNCGFESTKLVPFTHPVQDGLMSDTTLTFYPYDGAWIELPVEANIAPSPIPLDQYDRLYTFGDGVPRMRSRLEGVTRDWDLAMPVPAAPPGVSNPSALGTLTDTAIDVAYCYTYVSDMGEEGQPSPPSPVITVAANTNVTLTLPGGVPPTNRTIPFIRIYRVAAGMEGQDYAFVQEVSSSATSFSDGIPDLDLDEAVPSIDWDPPDPGMQGAVLMPGGFFAGWKGNTLMFSEPFMPHAWPLKYQQALEYDIVAVAAAGSAVIVGTTGHLYAVDAARPDQTLPTKLPLWQPCVSRRSMIAIGDSAYYASAEGVVAANGSTATLMTAATIDRKTWKSWKPETMVAGTWDGKLLMFAEQLTIIFDLEEPELLVTTSDSLAQAALVYEDKLFLRQEDRLTHWGESEIPMTAEWRSREYAATRPVAWSCARVVADSYPVGLAFFSEEDLQVEIHAQDATAFRLPPMRPEKNWSFQVTTLSKVDEVVIGTSMGDFNA